MYRGTRRVAEPPAARAGDRKRLLHQEVEQLVVEALRVGAGLDEVVKAVETRWAKLSKTPEVARK